MKPDRQKILATILEFTFYYDFIKEINKERRMTQHIAKCFVVGKHKLILWEENYLQQDKRLMCYQFTWTIFGGNCSYHSLVHVFGHVSYTTRLDRFQKWFRII